MEAVSISETSVNFYDSNLRNIPEERHPHTRRCEKLNPHFSSLICFENNSSFV
jgi:hypothetical protein